MLRAGPGTEATLWKCDLSLLLSTFFFLIYFLIGGKSLDNVCVGFCHITTPISHNHTYIPFLLNLPPLPSSPPSRASQSTRLGSLCYIATSPPSSPPSRASQSTRLRPLCYIATSHHCPHLFFEFWLHRAACGILVPRQGIKPRPLHWKHSILTTGPPGTTALSTL